MSINRADYQEAIASFIADQIKNENAPWMKPWEPGQARHSAQFMPINGTSGRDYHGINALHLQMKQLSMGYESNAWMTFLQAKNAGGVVRKGEKSSMVEFWNWPDKKAVQEEGPDSANEGDQAVRKGPTVFYAHVFNASQIDKLPERFYAPVPLMPEGWRHEEAERILKASGAVIRHDGGDRAFYRHDTDSIHLPLPAQFKSKDQLYSIILHELGHWSGSADRLNRQFGRFGDAAYAQEELRAELFSYFASQRIDLPHDPSQHMSYLKHWHRLVKDDPKAIFKACADAEKMCRFLGVEYANEKAMAFHAEQKESNVLAFPAKEKLVNAKKKSRGLAM